MIFAVLLVLLAGCNLRTGPAATATPTTPSEGGAVSDAEGTATDGGAITGTVAETMNSGGYTYLRVVAENRSVWAAAPETIVRVGEKVRLPKGMAMNNFASKTLNRSFDVIYFIGSFERVEGDTPQQQVAAAHGAIAKKKESAPLDTSGIVKADGGYTIGELFGDKDSLAGKEVAVRGKVTKFSAAVMGKNWLHLSDGTGSEGSNDLTVTTAAVADVGSTVLVHGTLTANKDFGYGYKYDLIIEDAQVTVE